MSQIPSPDPALDLVVKKLRNAFKRHGFDDDSYAFDLALRVRYGNEAAAIARFFNGEDDLPLGHFLRLCESIGLPAAQIMGEDANAHLILFDYLGGNPAHVFLPPGIAFDQSLLDDALFYMPAEGDLCDGVAEGDLLIMTRLTLAPQPGQLFLIESDHALMLRICLPDHDGQHRFARRADGDLDGLVTIPAGKQTSDDDTQGRPGLTGRLAWRIESSRPR